MEFAVKLNIRLDWSEMDLFGHINNVMFFKYIQASRVNYWETSGLTKQFHKDRIGPILASTNCQFRKPLYYPGNITVQVRVEFIKNSSFGLLHQILNEQGEVAAEAQDVIVMYDFNKKEKSLFPDDVRKVMKGIEKRTF